MSTPQFSMRMREDGGLTLARSGRGTVYVTPSMLRNARQFFPTFLLRRKNIKLRLTGEFWRQWKAERDYLERGISPFASHRVLDPAPDLDLLEGALRDARTTFPGLNGASIDTA